MDLTGIKLCIYNTFKDNVPQTKLILHQILEPTKERHAHVRLLTLYPHNEINHLGDVQDKVLLSTTSYLPLHKMPHRKQSEVTVSYMHFLHLVWLRLSGNLICVNQITNDFHSHLDVVGYSHKRYNIPYFIQQKILLNKFATKYLDKKKLGI